MSYNTHPHSTKSNLVYMIMPRNIIIITPELKNLRMQRSENVKELVRFQDSLNKRLATMYYELPVKAIALEEYLDYLVINLGIRAPEEKFDRVVDVALEKEKGLILKPPSNPSQLYLMDRIVLKYNDLHGHESIRY